MSNATYPELQGRPHSTGPISVSTLIKSGPCRLYGFLCVTGSGAFAIRDGLDASAAIVTQIVADVNLVQALDFDVNLKYGMFVEVSGGATSTLTVRVGQ